MFWRMLQRYFAVKLQKCTKYHLTSHRQSGQPLNFHIWENVSFKNLIKHLYVMWIPFPFLLNDIQMKILFLLIHYIYITVAFTGYRLNVKYFHSFICSSFTYHCISNTEIYIFYSREGLNIFCMSFDYISLHFTPLLLNLGSGPPRGSQNNF